ncbi:MAG: hypothetical protein ABWY11_13895, partial [Umezawaea sp.]
DAVFLPRLLESQLLWVWLSTWRALPKLTATEQSGHRGQDAPPRSTILTSRWVRLRTDAASLHATEIVEHADAVIGALVETYGDKATNLQLYPAFR